MKKAFLGIDLGTSAVKALLIAEGGKTLALGSSGLDFSNPKPAFAEQSPEDWWQGTVDAVHKALAACGDRPEVAGIGISGQMLGSVLMDKNGKADDHCIIWMDQRSAKERDYIEEKLGIETILNRTANYPLASLWAPKLLWLRKHEPERYAKIDKVLFPKDYLKYRLSGEYDIDVTDAPGTLLFNTAQRRWDDELFAALEIPRSLVPESLSESVDVIGSLSTAAAEALGLPAGIPVSGGGGDQMCGSLGLGVISTGMISSTIGTSGVVFSYSDTCIIDRQPRALLSYCHSVPGAYCLFGCTLAAGGAYQWLRDTFFKNDNVTWDTGGKSIYSYMDSLASTAKPGCEGLVFLPYLNGERTPYPDPDARGVFFGISPRHGAGEICRAVLEGVVYSLRDTIEILKEHGVPVREIRAAGGGAVSPLWLQMQADIFGAQVLVTNVQEAPAAGAAMLAAAGGGVYKNMEEAAADFVKIVRKCDPDPEKSRIYDDYYGSYRALYPALKPLYAKQARKVERQAT